MSDDFTRTDADAVHRAMMQAREEAGVREDRMPSSAQAFDRLAYDLKVVRNKILDKLGADVHRSYPDYEKERSLSPAEIEERYGSEPLDMDEELKEIDRRLVEKAHGDIARNLNST
jgi:hypothetical protein